MLSPKLPADGGVRTPSGQQGGHDAKRGGEFVRCESAVCFSSPPPQVCGLSLFPPRDVPLPGVWNMYIRSNACQGCYAPKGTTDFLWFGPLAGLAGFARGACASLHSVFLLLRSPVLRSSRHDAHRRGMLSQPTGKAIFIVAFSCLEVVHTSCVNVNPPVSLARNRLLRCCLRAATWPKSRRRPGPWCTWPSSTSREGRSTTPPWRRYVRALSC